jgi:hypothetical protein
MKTVCYLLSFYLILTISVNTTQIKSESLNKNFFFVLDINRPGMIPPMRMTDEVTGRDPFGVKWNEESGQLSFVGSLQAKEKGESLKHMQFEEKFIILDKEITLSSTISDNLVEYWEHVLNTLYEGKVVVEEHQLSSGNQISSNNSNKIIINKFDEKTLNHGFMINSKVCPNIFKESKSISTRENIEKFYKKNPSLLRSGIAVENNLIGKKFKAFYNGKSMFKMEIKKNDLIYNPNLMKRMITYFESDSYKSKKLKNFDETSVLNIRRKIIENFELQGGLDDLIAKSFIKYILNDHLQPFTQNLSDCKANPLKYFSVTTSDINMIAFRKFWNKSFPDMKLRLKYPKFGTSFILIFIGEGDKIDSINVYEDHMLRGKMSFEIFMERFYISQQEEESIFKKFCSN